MWRWRQRGGTECTAGGSAVVRRLIRAGRRPLQHWTDVHQRLGMHTKCCFYELWQSAASEELKKQRHNAGSPLFQRETLVQAVYLPHTHTIQPELLPMCWSCARILSFGLQVQDKTGRRWLCVVDTITECTSSASPHTPWYLLQDGVNDLHEIYRWISAVRGAWEVRMHFFNHLALSLYEMSRCYVIGRLCLGTDPELCAGFLCFSMWTCAIS